MKFTSTLFALCLTLTAVSASPVAGPNNPNMLAKLMNKRGYGCNCFTGDDVDQCNLHCLNDVRITCSNGSKIKPYKGTCGGVCTATCQCVYNKSCP